MSVGRSGWNIPTDTTNVVIGNDLYNDNQTRINQVQEYLNAWNTVNEEGNRNYKQIQGELARKIQEGEEAKRQLEALQQASLNPRLAITASGSTSTSQFIAPTAGDHSQQSHIISTTATIEEVTSPTQPVTRNTRQTEPYKRSVGYKEHPPTGSWNGPSHRLYANDLRATTTTYANGAQQGVINMEQWQRQQQHQHQQPVASSMTLQQQQQYYRRQQQQQSQPQSKTSMSQPAYYRPYTNQAAAAASTSVSSSLAGALGQPGQSSSSSVVRLDPAVPISQPKQTAPHVAPNGHVQHSQHSSQNYAANANALAPQTPTNASEFCRSRGSQSDSRPSPGFAPTAAASIAPTSTTKPVQCTTPKDTDTINSAEKLKLLAMDWARRAPPNSYLDLPNSGMKLYKDPVSNNILAVAPDGKGGFIPKDLIDLTSSISNANASYQGTSGNPPTPAEQMKAYLDLPQRNVNASDSIHGRSPMPPPGMPLSTSANLAVGQPASQNIPVTQKQRTLRTPAQADKTHLAKDILRALGHSAGLKRRRSDEGPQGEVISEWSAKRRAVNPTASSDDNPVLAADPVGSGSAAPSEILVAEELEKGVEEEETPGMVLQTPPKRDQSLDVEPKAEFEESPLPPLIRPTPPIPNAFPAQRPPPQRSTLFASVPEATGEVVGENRKKPENPTSPFPTSRSVPSTATTQQPSTYFSQTSVNSVSYLPSTVSSGGAMLASRGQTEASVGSVDNEPSAMHSTSSSSKIVTPPSVTPELRGFPYPGGTASNKLPLFLPSPSESPPRMSLSGYGATVQYPDPYLDDDFSLPVASLEQAGGENQTMQGRYRKSRTVVERAGDAPHPKIKKRQQVYVLVPPPPDYVIRDLARRARLRRKNRDSDEEEDSDDVRDQGLSRHNKGRGNSFNINDVTERMAVQETSSRLRERPCLWNGCDTVMNSTEKLILHLAQHKPKGALKAKIQPTSTFSCLWKQCGLRFSEAKFMYHLESHALSPLFCAFQDCDGFFRTPRQLVQHNLLVHNSDFLRPSTDPFKPRIPPSLPPAPEVLPSYTVEPRSVFQASISRDRHKVLGEWVLRNIFGPVKLGPRKHKAAVPLRTSRRDASDAQGIGFNQYDFLTSSSSMSTKMPEFDELNSVEVSQLANQGLVLWHIADLNGDENPVDSTSDHKDDNELETFGNMITEAEEKEGSAEVAVRNRSFTSDEETVQIMLTGM